MARKRRRDKPFDFAFTIMDNEFPEELHINLNVPGIYKKKINKKVYFKDGSVGRMDSSYLVDPDFVRIFEQMAVNGEHQSTPVGDEKITMIGYYGIQQIHDERVPQLSYVVSKIPKEKHVQVYERSPTDIVKPLFICFDEEEIRKRLSNVEDIINNQVDIGNVDALSLGIIVLFAPRRSACEITEKVVELYIRIAKKLSRKMESTLYIVICSMIDAYFDDEEEFRRMMKMMRENTSVESTERFVSLDIFQNDLAEADARLVEADARIAESDARLVEADARIAESDARLVEADARIAESDARIKELEDEIADLKRQIEDSK